MKLLYGLNASYETTFSQYKHSHNPYFINKLLAYLIIKGYEVNDEVWTKVNAYAY